MASWRTLCVLAFSDFLVIACMHHKSMAGRIMVPPTGHARSAAPLSRGVPSVSWRMPAGRDPVPAHGHRHQIVQMQRDHCGTARGRPPQDHHTILTSQKVPAPALAPGMEQPHAPLAQGITPMGLLALEQIAETPNRLPLKLSAVDPLQSIRYYP